MRANKILGTLAFGISIAVASPFPEPVAEPVAEPQLPVSLPVPIPSSSPPGIPPGLPVGLPAGAPTGLPVGAPTGLPVSLPTGLPASLPTGTPVGLPNLPVGGGAGIGGSINGVSIPGLSTNPSNLINSIAEAVEILQYISTLLQTALSTGTINIPGIAGVGLGVQGVYLSALLSLAKGLIPTS